MCLLPVMQYIIPQVVSFVGHGTVLNGTREHEDISRLSLHLDGVFEELVPVIRIAGVDVGPGSDGGAAILLSESAISES